MKDLATCFLRAIWPEDGQGLAEYTLILLLVLTGAVLSLGVLGLIVLDDIDSALP